jgi:hypothetical protein
MSFFDFSESVRRAQNEASDKATRLSAKTTVHIAEFPGAVRRAGFRLLSDEGFAPGAHDLVIGAAPWSDFDLEVLERLVSAVRGRTVRVIVFDIDGLSYAEMVRLLPGMRRFTQTPVVLQYRDAELAYFGEGRAADLWLQQF